METEQYYKFIESVSNDTIEFMHGVAHDIADHTGHPAQAIGVTLTGAAQALSLAIEAYEEEFGDTAVKVGAEIRSLFKGEAA